MSNTNTNTNARTDRDFGLGVILADRIAEHIRAGIIPTNGADASGDVSDREFWDRVESMRAYIVLNEHKLERNRVAIRDGAHMIVRDLLDCPVVRSVLSVDVDAGRVAIELRHAMPIRIEGKVVRCDRISFAIESGASIVRNLRDGGTVLDRCDRVDPVDWLRPDAGPSPEPEGDDEVPLFG